MNRAMLFLRLVFLFVPCAFTAGKAIARPVEVPAVSRSTEPDSGTFEAAGPEHRFDEILQRIRRGGFFSSRAGREQWNNLVQTHRAAIVASSSHAEFADRLNALIAATGQSHFQYFTDDELDYWLLSSALERGGARLLVDHVGIIPSRISGRWFVAGILESSPASDADICVGDELVAVDDGPFTPVEAFRGRSGRPVQIELRRTPGHSHFVELVPVRESMTAAIHRAMRASIRSFVRDGRTFVYAHVWTLLGAGRMFSDLAAEAADADGVILDFRDGYGGTTTAATWFLLGRGPSPVGGRSLSPPACPMVVLTGAGTRSAKEIVVNAARDANRIIMVGERTAGAVTTVDLAHTGPVGLDGYLMLPGQRLSLEGKPQQPDFAMSRKIPYAAGADPQLELGTEVLSAWLVTH
ncbi:MAG: hypothetical protein J5J06_03500 [Phycisphaerae bacterium]|nr:hypothetical protein [Phycisphaerae bacterium]